MKRLCATVIILAAAIGFCAIAAEKASKNKPMGFRIVESKKFKINPVTNKMTAHGNVKAILADGVVYCDHVEIELNKKNNKPEKVVATGNVYIKMDYAQDASKKKQTYHAVSNKAIYDAKTKELTLEKESPDSKIRPRLLVEEAKDEDGSTPEHYQLIFADTIKFNTSDAKTPSIDADNPKVLTPARNVTTVEKLMKIEEQKALKLYSYE